MKYLFLLFISASAFGQKKLDTIRLVSNKVKILVPHELKPMSDQMWNLKYNNRPRPLLALGDEDAEVNFIGELTKQPASEEQLGSFKDFQIQYLKDKKPGLVVLSEGVKSINGRKVAYIKFLSNAIDQKVFNYMFFAIVEGKVMLFSFNCIEKLQKGWEPDADEIMASLRVAS